jgi:hypothetical protein
MTSTFTTNKKIEKPSYNDYVSDPTGWTVPVNNDWDIIDKSFGGTTVKNPTGVSGTVNLIATEYQSAIIVIGASISSAATLTANINYTIPSGVGGVWSIFNNTTGAFTITFSSLGGGTSIVLAQGLSTTVFSDGTNIRLSDSRISTPGSNTQVIYNSSGTLAGSANFTFDGTNVTAAGAYTDAIGNVRNVPINSKTASYVLIASDSGKVISITTGGVTVPASIFTAGNTITIYNNSATDQTITQGSGVTMVLAGVGTTGNRTLGGYGLMTLVCVATDTFVATGSGLT